ncbi:sulfatase-like hydrolase/transferase [bacterium]|nr:sulfatase-like hydrolase/transferase [bacterium]
MHRHLIRAVLFVLLGLAGSLSASAAKDRPNIILIMADDLGVEGIGSYGGTSYKTPAIDRLATQGVRFTQAYAQPLCTNTRIQLMTGLYNNRNWLYFGTLDPKAKTFGHYMQEAGYSTCIAGKWQLQSYDPPSYPGSHLRRGKGMEVSSAGFDEYSLFHSWHSEDKGTRFRDPTFYENGKLLKELDGKYGPDHWVDFINDFIERKKDDEKPFFVYYAMALPHRPFVPTPESADWGDKEAHINEDPRYFPDMVEYMDKCVGRVIKQVDDLGLGDNTVVIYYSDNGTHRKITSQTKNGPVVGGKGRTTDAGTHVPLMVRWTGKIKPGLNDNLVDSTDFLPTVMEAAGQPISRSANLDGISFYPQLFGESDQVRPWVFCHYDPRPGWDKDQFRKIRFARDKQYKLYGDGKLYDVPNDKLEKSPILAASDTEATRMARQRLSAVLKDMPNPDPAPRDGDPRDSEQRLYLAAGNQLTMFDVNKDNGELTLLQELPLAGAGPFTFAPNRKRMYSASSMPGEAKKAQGIATVQIGKGGRLELENIGKVNLRPGYLMTDNNGEFLAGNHYGPGKASIWKIDPVYRGETLEELTLEQKAHSAVFSPDNHWLLVPATGPNKVFVNHFTAQVGTLEPHDPPFANGPTGEDDARQPRHLIFHPNLSLAYTTNEREQPGVGVWQWDTEAGRLMSVQNIVTQPKGFSGSITTADLHMTPDARFLYVSNRDITKRGAPTGNDSIVGFSVDPQTGGLKLIGHYPCERVPRSFTIDKLGKYLYVAGQGDAKLGAYRIEESGALKKLKQYEVGKGPIWVETMSILE